MTNNFNKGADGYNKANIVRALIAMQIEGIRIDKSDPNRADWGAKNVSNYNVIKWFGFKLHIACDVKAKIPIKFKLTPANEADSKNALPLIKDTHSFFNQKP